VIIKKIENAYFKIDFKLFSENESHLTIRKLDKLELTRSVESLKQV